MDMYIYTYYVYWERKNFTQIYIFKFSESKVQSLGIGEDFSYAIDSNCYHMTLQCENQ